MNLLSGTAMPVTRNPHAALIFLLGIPQPFRAGVYTCHPTIQCTMPAAAAVAIANARSFEENESLRNQLEQERDYLREEVQARCSVPEFISCRFIVSDSSDP